MQSIVSEQQTVQVLFNEDNNKKMLIIWDGAPINTPFGNTAEAVSKLHMDQNIWDEYAFIP